jgi:hypothetical protein
MDRRRLSPLCIGFGALALMLACSNQNGSTEGSGTGGESTTGGSGGDTGSGGSGTGGFQTGTGGAGTGGVQGGAGAGGTKATGGTTGTGGGKAGASGSGGQGGGAGKAGASGTGGASATGGSGGSSGSSGSTGSGGIPFKGFAGDPTACADMQHLGVSWYYNWKQTPTSGCASTGIPFVPMVWGHTGSEQSASGIMSSVSSFVSKGYGYVLGFNEPDNSTQSNITDATAVALWPSFNNTAIQLGTPATQANSTGQTWFKSFMGSVNGSTTLHADFIAIHWYGWNAGSCDAAASQFESYIKYAEGFSGNRPIWVTEWGCLNDSAPDTQTVLSFYQGALAVFAKHPRVARYSWYPWSTNNELVNSDGTLTTLGNAYAAAPAYK